MSVGGVQFTGTIPNECVLHITYVVADDMHTDCLDGQIITSNSDGQIILIRYQAMKISEFIKTSDTFRDVVYSDEDTMNRCVDHFGSDIIEKFNFMASNPCSEMDRGMCFKNVSTIQESYSIRIAYLNNPDMKYDKYTIQTAITTLFMKQYEFYDSALKDRHVSVITNPPPKSAMS